MKIRIGVGVECIHPTSSIVFDTDYQAVLTKATALNYNLPSYAQQLLQNQLVLDIKASGAWSKLDVFYMFANNGSKEFGTLNWKNPNSYQATIVGSNLTWNASGFIGGATSYLDTLFNPTSVGLNIAQNNASIGIWKRTHDATAGKFLWGNSGSYSYAPSISNTDVRLHNAGGLSASFGLSNTGLLILNRTSSTAMSWSVNGTATSGTTSATSPTYVVNAKYSIFTYATATASTYLGQISSWFIGQSIVSETPAFYTAMNTYIAST